MATSAYELLRRQLQDIGLVGPEIEEFINRALVEGWTDAQFDIELRLTPEFKERFSVIDQIQQHNLGNPSDIRHVPTPSEILEYEAAVRRLVQAYGLPTGFLNSNDDIQSLMFEDVSLSELDERFQAGFVKLSTMPMEVRNAFSMMFGIGGGDRALAAYILDPDLALPVLQEQVRMAEIKGAGIQFGLDLTRQRTEQLAAEGLDFDQSQDVFAQVARMSAIFSETIGEDEDLTAEGEGIDFVLGRTNEPLQRLEERQAQFSAKGGAAVASTGLTGLGEA